MQNTQLLRTVCPDFSKEVTALGGESQFGLDLSSRFHEPGQMGHLLGWKRWTRPSITLSEMGSPSFQTLPLSIRLKNSWRLIARSLQKITLAMSRIDTWVVLPGRS